MAYNYLHVNVLIDTQMIYGDEIIIGDTLDVTRSELYDCVCLALSAFRSQ